MSLLFTAGKVFIGLYSGHSALTSAYGAAASLVVFLIWIYYSAQILLFGAELTHAYTVRYGSRMQGMADDSDVMRASVRKLLAEELNLEVIGVAASLAETLQRQAAALANHSINASGARIKTLKSGVIRSKENDWSLWEHFLQPFRGFNPVHTRHRQVKDDEVRV